LGRLDGGALGIEKIGPITYRSIRYRKKYTDYIHQHYVMIKFLIIHTAEIGTEKFPKITYTNNTK
jgi:hypothetical protein